MLRIVSWDCHICGGHGDGPEAMTSHFATHGIGSSAFERRAAPAQPGEGEPSADELAAALEAVVNSFTRPEEEAAHAAARALLERRGGKGLDGKGGWA